jgi:serine/threonine protein kinase
MELMGFGAYGLVFRAKRNSDGQTVAVKLVIARPEVFLRELRALLYLRERNGCERTDLICYEGNFKALMGQKLLDEVDRFAKGDTRLRLENFEVPLATPNDKGVFIETRFVRGENMHDLMKRRKPETFTFEQHAHLLLSLLRGLAFMHRNKIVHRDVKPPNIMVVNAESALAECVLIDVGDACRVEGRTDFRFGNCDDYAGTHAYLAPSLIALEARDVPPRDIELSLRMSFDVYAAGLTFYDWGRNDFAPAVLGEREAIEIVRREYDTTFPPRRLPDPPYFPEKLDDADGTIGVIVQEMLLLDDENRTDADVAAGFLENELKQAAAACSAKRK